MQLYNLDITPSNLLFMSRVGWHRLLFKLSGKLDPISTPYISGDTFRSLAKHILDKRQSVDPSNVGRNEVVFVEAGAIKDYFQTIHSRIRYPYILITHNGDTNIEAALAKYIDSKIIHWYAQNVLVSHPKLTPIPIGLENLDYYNHGITSIFDELRSKNVDKKSQILYGFSISTNPTVRKSAQMTIERLTTSVPVSTRLNSEAYLKELMKYQFVASPPGHGFDCHRTWEALYLRTIPIVMRSVATEYFQSQGLPLVLISDWSELERYDSKKLDQIYQREKHKLETDALWFSYWRKMLDL